MNQKHSKEYKSIGQTIKKYRKLRGLTQEQLADMVCISISYLTKIEAPNCDQPFSLEVILDKMCIRDSVTSEEFLLIYPI